jgi:hypothetical protein
VEEWKKGLVVDCSIAPRAGYPQIRGARWNEALPHNRFTAGKGFCANFEKVQSRRGDNPVIRRV